MKYNRFNPHDSKEEEKIKENYDFNNVQAIKQEELLNHMNDLKQEYNSNINNLQTSLDHLSLENDAYCCQITAIKQHNEYLRETSNQWRTRYNHANILLLNTEEEIFNLKTELKNIKLLYTQHISQVENEQFDTHVSSDSDSENKQKYIETFEQYMKENKQLKSENMKYLNQLEDITNKYTDINIKYKNLMQMQKDMQHELTEAKSKINECNNVINEYFIENTSLKSKNNDLKQALNDMNNTKPIDGSLMHVSFIPSSNPYMHVRSISNHSICNTPIVHESDNDNKCIDLYNIDEDTDVSKNDLNNQMENVYDLYQAMNDCLFQIDDSIQAIKTMQLLSKNRPEMSNKFRSSGSKCMDFNDQKQDSDDCGDRDDLVEEDFQMVFDNYEEQQSLLQIQNFVEQLTNYLSEMHKEQIAIIEDEKVKYNILDETYQQYKIEMKKKMKRLRKDVYKTEYKKCNLLLNMTQWFK